MATTSKPASWKSVVITQLIAVTAFVGIPILITFMAPLTTVRFEHTSQGIVSHLDRYLLIYLPWKSEEIVGVQKVTADVTAAKRYRGTSEERRKGQKGVQLATAQLVITTAGPESTVQADPELARRIEKEFVAFASDTAAEELRYDVYASWWLSYVLGGIASGFAVLYVFGATMQILLSVAKKLFVSTPSAS